MPEGKEKEQEIENLFEKKKMKELRFGKGNRQISPGSTESPKQMDTKRTTPRHTIIKMPKVKDKES